MYSKVLLPPSPTKIIFLRKIIFNNHSWALTSLSFEIWDSSGGFESKTIIAVRHRTKLSRPCLRYRYLFSSIADPDPGSGAF
jgi:hypothetical protein